MEVRKITNSEIADAMDLVWEVFQEFEAPDYSAEGIHTFQEFIQGQIQNTTITLYGAFENETLVGVIATRSEGSHISLFFVSKKYHRQGIGRKLFEFIIPLCGATAITVNSSPYAAEIYRRLGFLDQNTEQLTDGLRYIPMKYIK